MAARVICVRDMPVGRVGRRSCACCLCVLAPFPFTPPPYTPLPAFPDRYTELLQRQVLL